MTVTIEQIKKLREETDLSVGECKIALQEANGDIAKAKEILIKKGKKLAEKRVERETGQGIIEAYVHPNKRIGAMVELRCESDFVSRSPEFQKLAHELCLQVAGIPTEEMELLEQPWIKDESKKIKELVDEYIAKFGENIILKRFVRYEL
jgi:elongation factor Ts